MKNVFAVKKMDKKDQNVTTDGSVFINKKLSDELTKKLEEAVPNVTKEVEKKDKSKGVVIVEYVALIIAIIVLLVAAEIIFSNKFMETLNNSWFIYLIGIAAAIVYFLIKYVYKKKEQTVEESPELKSALNEMENIDQEIKDYYQVPSDAINLDVYGHEYIVKSDKVKIINHLVFTHVNFEKWCYVKENKLYLIDYENQYEIPVESIKKIMRTDKKIMSYGWNKEMSESDIKKLFNEHKITINNYGVIIAKPYEVIIEDDKYGEFIIQIAPYEAEVVSRLLNVEII